jgi:PleD family two-component response regulator
MGNQASVLAMDRVRKRLASLRIEISRGELRITLVIGTDRYNALDRPN